MPCAVLAVVLLCLVPGHGAQAQQRLSARVSAVSQDSAGTVVVVAAGQEQGLQEDVHVLLLREAEPIVHPLTGAVLGVPQEPVGEAVVTGAQAHESRARLTRSYSPPAVGDIVEYEPRYATAAPAPSAPAPAATPSAAAPSPAPPAAAAVPANADSLQARMAALEQELARYRRAGQAQPAVPVFAEQVWEEITALRSHMLSLNERLVQLEGRQEEDRGRLGAVLTGRLRQEESQEFTIRYSPRAEVRLRVAGTTLLVDVDVDTLRLHELGPASAAPPPGQVAAEPQAAAPPATEQPRAASADTGAPQLAEDQAAGGEPAAAAPEGSAAEPAAPAPAPWYRTPHAPLAAMLGVVLVGVAVYHSIRRRHEARMAELEEYDDQLLEEEEEEA